MTQKKPDEERDVIDSENQKRGHPLNPHYLAIAMGQANMTHARALATIMGDEKDNPDTDE
ncbi:hypothetical protein KKA33_04400 [Patescibacteria group bacterium]|nr:hypothetical protein [Patescibacteria group bacterium]